MAGLRATDTDHHIGKRINEARLAAGLSQRVLAEAIGISSAQVQKYEAGSNCISACSLQVIAGLVGQPIGWFFEPSTACAAPESITIEEPFDGAEVRS